MKYTVKQIMMLARRVRLNLNVYYLINWAKSLYELYQVLNPITTSSKKVSFLPFLPSRKEFSTFSTFSNFVVYSDYNNILTLVRRIIKGRLGATLFQLIEPAQLPPNYINIFTSISKISLTGFWGTAGTP